MRILLQELLLIVLLLVPRRFPQDPQVVARHFDEPLAATVHEPNFELNLPGELIVERTTESVPVVSSEHRLLELFVVRQGQRQVDGLKLRLAARVNQDQTSACHDHFSLAFELAHSFDLELKLDAEPL